MYLIILENYLLAIGSSSNKPLYFDYKNQQPLSTTNQSFTVNGVVYVTSHNGRVKLFVEDTQICELGNANATYYYGTSNLYPIEAGQKARYTEIDNANCAGYFIPYKY